MEVLQNLSESEVKALRQRFAEPLDVDDFVMVLQEAVNAKPGVRVSKTRLRELFNDIDVNGDLSVSWDEFTMYIIDGAAAAGTVASVSARDAPLQSYQHVSTIDTEVPGSVAHTRYLPAIDKIVRVVRRDRFSKIRLCHAKPALTGWLELSRSPTAVLSVDVIPPNTKKAGSLQNHLVASHVDNSVRFYELTPEHRHTHTARGAAVPVGELKLKRVLQVSEAQSTLRWSTHHNHLFCGSRTGIVSAYLPESDEAVGRERIHLDGVNDMTFSTSGSTLITASLDSTIKGTDLSRGVVKFAIPQGPATHSQGVYLLSSPGASQPHALYSAGLEPYPLLHALNNTRMPPQKLEDKSRPHRGRIVWLHAVPNTPQLLTADNTGLMKLWDARTLSCVQSLPTAKEDIALPALAAGVSPGSSSSLTAAVYLPKQRSIAVHGRATKVYRYAASAEPELADEAACQQAVWNPLSRAMLTLHRTTAKLWDGDTGTLRSVHNILSSDATAVCLQLPRMRKFFVGCADGTAHIFGFAMCNSVGELPVPKGLGPLIALCYVDGLRENRTQYILVAARRTVCLVPDDETRRGALSLHCFDSSLKANAARSVAVTEGRLCVVGTDGGRILVADLSSFAMTAVFDPGLRGAVAALQVWPDATRQCVAAAREALLDTTGVPLNSAFSFASAASAVFGNANNAGSSGASGGTLGAQNGLGAQGGGGFGGGSAGGVFTPGGLEEDLLSGTDSASSMLGVHNNAAAGIIFAGDATGGVSIVRLVTSQALETVATWRNSPVVVESPQASPIRSDPGTFAGQDKDASSKTKEAEDAEAGVVNDDDDEDHNIAVPAAKTKGAEDAEAGVVNDDDDEYHNIAVPAGKTKEAEDAEAGVVNDDDDEYHNIAVPAAKTKIPAKPAHQAANAVKTDAQKDSTSGGANGATAAADGATAPAPGHTVPTLNFSAVRGSPPAPPAVPTSHVAPLSHVVDPNKKTRVQANEAASAPGGPAAAPAKGMSMLEALQGAQAATQAAAGHKDGRGRGLSQTVQPQHAAPRSVTPPRSTPYAEFATLDTQSDVTPPLNAPPFLTRHPNPLDAEDVTADNTTTDNATDGNATTGGLRADSTMPALHSDLAETMVGGMEDTDGCGGTKGPMGAGNADDEDANDNSFDGLVSLRREHTAPPAAHENHSTRSGGQTGKVASNAADDGQLHGDGEHGQDGERHQHQQQEEMEGSKNSAATNVKSVALTAREKSGVQDLSSADFAPNSAGSCLPVLDLLPIKDEGGGSDELGPSPKKPRRPAGLTLGLNSFKRRREQLRRLEAEEIRQLQERVAEVGADAAVAASLPPGQSFAQSFLPPLTPSRATTGGANRGVQAMSGSITSTPRAANLAALARSNVALGVMTPRAGASTSMYPAGVGVDLSKSGTPGAATTPRRGRDPHVAGASHTLSRSPDSKQKQRHGVGFGNGKQRTLSSSDGGKGRGRTDSVVSISASGDSSNAAGRGAHNNAGLSLIRPNGSPPAQFTDIPSPGDGAAGLLLGSVDGSFNADPTLHSAGGGGGGGVIGVGSGGGDLIGSIASLPSATTTLGGTLGSLGSATLGGAAGGGPLAVTMASLGTSFGGGLGNTATSTMGGAQGLLSTTGSAGAGAGLGGSHGGGGVQIPSPRIAPTFFTHSGGVLGAARVRQKMQNQQRERERREKAEMARVLGARPNSAVAAYFKPDAPGALPAVPGITSIHFLEGPRILVTGDDSGKVTTWDIERLVTTAVMLPPTRRNDSLALEAADELEVSLRAAQGVVPVTKVRVPVDLAIPQAVASWQGHADDVTMLCEPFGSLEAHNEETPMSPGAFSATPGAAFSLLPSPTAKATAGMALPPPPSSPGALASQRLPGTASPVPTKPTATAISTSAMKPTVGGKGKTTSSAGPVGTPGVGRSPPTDDAYGLSPSAAAAAAAAQIPEWLEDGFFDGGLLPPPVLSSVSAVIASAGSDRMVRLWSTDGIDIGNFAQGRARDEPAPPGASPYILSGAPFRAWTKTATVKRQTMLEVADEAAGLAISTSTAGFAPREFASPDALAGGGGGGGGGGSSGLGIIGSLDDAHSGGGAGSVFLTEGAPKPSSSSLTDTKAGQSGPLNASPSVPTHHKRTTSGEKTDVTARRGSAGGGFSLPMPAGSPARGGPGGGGSGGGGGVAGGLSGRLKKAALAKGATSMFQGAAEDGYGTPRHDTRRSIALPASFTGIVNKERAQAALSRAGPSTARVLPTRPLMTGPKPPDAAPGSARGRRPMTSDAETRAVSAADISDRKTTDTETKAVALRPGLVALPPPPVPKRLTAFERTQSALDKKTQAQLRELGFNDNPLESFERQRIRTKGRVVITGVAGELSSRALCE